MANTNFTVNDPLAVKLWAKKLAVQAIQQTWFRNFISDDGNNVIYMLDDAEKSAGDTVNVGLRTQLAGAGVQGDGTLEGQEEALTTYADKLLVDQLRHAVNVGGRMTQQRVPFELREEARMGLQDWWAARFDLAFFNQLCGYTVQSDTRYTGNNAPTAPTRIILPNSHTTESQLTSSDTFTLSLVDTAVERAYLNNPYLIRPIRIKGEDKYVCFIHPSQVTDLRTSTSAGQWLDIVPTDNMNGEPAGVPDWRWMMGYMDGKQRPLGLGQTFLDMYGGNLPDDGLGRALLQGDDPGMSGPAMSIPGTSGKPDPTLLHQAMTAFGETGGVYPQMAPGKTGIYSPASYDPGSAAQLQLARSWIAKVRLANPKVTEKAPPTSNPIERQAWERALDAATAAKDVTTPDGVSHFYLRQGPTPDGAPPWAKAKPIKTFGPFINTGGGDVPKGPNMYIDFFGGK